MQVWEDCPQNWHYYYQEELSRKRKAKAFFDFGNYSHELMHVYYQLLRSGNHRPGSDFLISAMQSRVKQDLDATENIQLLSVVWPRILNYLKNQSPKIDTGISVQGIEYEFHSPVTTPNGRRVMLHGIIDLAYNDSAGKFRIRDHKTFGNPKSHTTENIKLNPQLLFYAIAMSTILGHDALAVEINAISSTITKVQKTPAELFNLIRYDHTPVGLSIARENLLKKIDLMFDTNPWMNYRPGCSNCQFFDICHLESRGLNTTGLIRQTYEKGKRSARIKANSHSSSKENTNGHEGFTISLTGI